MSIEIKDRVAVGDNKYTMTTLDDGRVQLDPSPDSVQEEGTPINKDLLQPILDSLQTSVYFKRVLTDADDLDDIRENGIYYFQTASRPANAPFENAGVVDVFGGESLSSQKIQRVYRYGASGQSAYRPLYNDEWLSWKRDVLVCGLIFFGTAESGDVSFPGSISAQGLHAALLNGDDVNLFCDFPDANIERLYFSPASKTGRVFYFESPIFDGCRFFSLAVSASGAYLELKSKNLFLEEGTTGGWHYRKWDAGECEIWGKSTYRSTGISAGGEFQFDVTIPVSCSGTCAFIHPITNVYRIRKAYPLSASGTRVTVYAKLEDAQDLPEGSAVTFILNVKGNWK